MVIYSSYISTFTLFFLGWNQEDLEQLRLCRNRAYYKVNTKRRQHLQASLSTYLQKEWQSQNPASTHSAKELLRVYQEYFEPETTSKRANGISPRGGGRGRGRGRGSGWGRGGGRGGGRPLAAASKLAAQVPDPNAGQDKVKSDIEDHSDKQWNDTMLSNLMLCNDIVAERQAANPGDKSDFAAMLHEEWLKLYPHSTLNSRNIKSRLTVYLKTMGDSQSPNKRRKLEQFSWNVEKKSLLRTIIKKHRDVADEDERIIAIFQEFVVQPGCTNLNLNEVKSMVHLLANNNKATSKQSNNSINKSVKVEQVTDEFAPESSEDNSNLNADDTEEEPINDYPTICDKNHWVHLFSDTDRNVECILTEQLLQIRKSLEGSFEGCDIYQPRKPKGLSSMVLEEWKKYYPDAEETNKTIGFKLAKYDRGPEANEHKTKVSPSGRTFWSPQMLQKLQETRQIAQALVTKSGREISLTKAWKQEWTKAYPDLNLDWRTVISRYHYHFGTLDSVNESGGSSDGSKVDAKDSFENGGGKVKGFRNWTQSMEIDLIETKIKVLKADPSLEKGSSEFNRALLREFHKVYPKCMESARSLYSKLQSVEKDLTSSQGTTPNSTPKATPARSDSVDFVPKSIKTEPAEEVPENNENSKYTFFVIIANY